MDFSELRKADEDLAQIAPNLIEQLKHSAKGVPFETTVTVMCDLLGAVDSLKEGFLQLAEADNVYAANALFRVFLEHILKMCALHLDSTGKLYDALNGNVRPVNELAEQYLNLLVAEAWRFLKAIENAGLDRKDFPNAALTRWFDEADALEKSPRDMEEPFQYRKLIETINKWIDQQDPFLANVIPNYSELSGFVHGGPSAIVIMGLLASQELRTRKLISDGTLVALMFWSARGWLFMMGAATSDELKKAYEQYEKSLEAIRSKLGGK